MKSGNRGLNFYPHGGSDAGDAPVSKLKVAQCAETRMPNPDLRKCCPYDGHSQFFFEDTHGYNAPVGYTRNKGHL